MGSLCNRDEGFKYDCNSKPTEVEDSVTENIDLTDKEGKVVSLKKVSVDDFRYIKVKCFSSLGIKQKISKPKFNPA